MLKKRSLLGILLTLCMFIAMMPLTTFATNNAAMIGNQGYPTLQEAINAVQNGQEIVLQKDVNERIQISNSDPISFVLNLNNHTVDSKAVDNEDVLEIYSSGLTLTIKNGTLTNTAPEAPAVYGIYAYTNADNLNLTLDNVTVDTSDQSVGVQGMNSNQNVLIKNSVIKSNTTAIYFPPITGKLTIDNSQITAIDNGIVVKGGTVDIKGSNTRISATGVPKDQDKPYDGNTSGAGFPQTGNAVYIEGGYSAGGDASKNRPIDVTILDGVLDSANSASVAANFLNKVNPYSNDQDAKISGGIFSSDVSQFVSDTASSAILKSSGASTYYVGAPATVSERITAAAKKGDEITVKQGSISFEKLPENITVKNTGDGDVTANGVEVKEVPVTTVHAHTIIKVPAKAPTSTEKGWKEYWKCEECGQIFLDAAGEKPATLTDVTLAAKPSSPTTGDNSNMTLWIVIMAAAAAAIAGLSIYGRRKHSR